MRWRPVFVVLVSGLALTGCAAVEVTAARSTTVRGSGHVVSEPREVRDFTGVVLAGIGELTIEQTGTESLTIQAEDNILPLLTSDVSSGTLRLGTRSNTSITTTEPIIYRLTVKDLDSLTVSGSGDATALDLQTGAFTVDVSGSGNVTVGGTATTQDVSISGSGTYTAEDLASNAAEVTISGSGNAVVRVSETLDATISGSGSVAYIGDPAVSQRVSGSGTITRR